MDSQNVTTDGEGPALEQVAELFRALAHPVRLQILDAVRAAERSVGEIEEATGIGQPGLSQQLAVLRKAELVLTQRTGKQVFYRVDGRQMQILAQFLGGRMAGGGVGAPAGEVADDPAMAIRGGAAGFARVLR